MLAAAPAADICSPADGNDGRSCGRAYLSDVAAPEFNVSTARRAADDGEHLLADDSLPSSSNSGWELKRDSVPVVDDSAAEAAYMDQQLKQTEDLRYLTLILKLP